MLAYVFTQVRAGSLLEPNDIPGLAHLTEHMLFYSSEKYPQEDEYSKFIQARGGQTNAYTASEDTNYSVSILAGSHSLLYTAAISSTAA
jgi:insulysin